MAIGSKLGIDATKKLPGEGEGGKAVQASLKRWVDWSFQPQRGCGPKPEIAPKAPARDLSEFGVADNPLTPAT